MMQQFTIVFYFKQKTAYEIRISDWSSDVCSSDLVALLVDVLAIVLADVFLELVVLHFAEGPSPGPRFREVIVLHRDLVLEIIGREQRSEERRVGKDCVSTCRSQCSTYH